MAKQWESTSNNTSNTIHMKNNGNNNRTASARCCRHRLQTWGCGLSGGGGRSLCGFSLLALWGLGFWV